VSTYFFVTPPGWPQPPPGWTPPDGGRPDHSWPPASPDWQFWQRAPAEPTPSAPVGLGWQLAPADLAPADGP
jgi:hypothetical protein